MQLMKTAIYLASGMTLGLSLTAAPTLANAGDVSAPPPVQLGKDCGYNSLFCKAGQDSCIICGSGSNATCKEDHTSCFWITY